MTTSYSEIKNNTLLMGVKHTYRATDIDIKGYTKGISKAMKWIIVA